MKRNQFTFYRSFYEAVSELSKKDQVEVILAICGYALDEKEPDLHGVPAAVFALIRPNLDSGRRKAENRLGHMKKEQTDNKATTNDNQKGIKDKPSKEQAENKREKKRESECKRESERECEYEYIYNNTHAHEITKQEQKPVRHKYGSYQNVLLSDQDLSKLKTEFPQDWQSRIEDLSQYMASKGVSYKDYLATIRSWARRDAAREAAKPTPKQQPKCCTEDEAWKYV